MSIEYDFTFPGGKQVEASFEGFNVRTDQPEKAGGDGEYPDPVDFFFVALGSCSATIAQEFCKSREIATDGMHLRVVAEKSDETKLYDQIELQLTLPDDFPQKYRKAIVRALDQCTVKKHIQGTLQIASTVVE